VTSGGGARTKEKETGKKGELVVTNPKLASLIYHSFVSSIILIFIRDSYLIMSYC
jgi:hypothetical protein